MNLMGKVVVEMSQEEAALQEMAIKIEKRTIRKMVIHLSSHIHILGHLMKRMGVPKARVCLSITLLNNYCFESSCTRQRIKEYRSVYKRTVGYDTFETIQRKVIHGDERLVSLLASAVYPSMFKVTSIDVLETSNTQSKEFKDQLNHRILYISKYLVELDFRMQRNCYLGDVFCFIPSIDSPFDRESHRIAFPSRSTLLLDADMDYGTNYKPKIASVVTPGVVTGNGIMVKKALVHLK
jgi:hypothetical protein